MTIDNLAAGETVIARESFSPSPVLFWLKTEMTVTEKRISGRQPNTFAGIIPVGASQILYPLKQVSSIGVETRVRPIRVAVGAILALAGLLTLGSSVGAALMLIVIGALLFLGGLRAAMAVTNNAGNTSYVTVTLFEKARLEAFASRAAGHLLDL
ncbi:hypothetical protein ABEG17_06595 [Pedococcus sp. KACC 23699]|uniref:Uncharacterized protein n=1 Tax=Pedococcus sp. KACC 23699 TaxID=3149228 RepID=A0AAU7JXS6_9MICO